MNIFTHILLLFSLVSWNGNIIGLDDLSYRYMPLFSHSPYDEYPFNLYFPFLDPHVPSTSDDTPAYHQRGLVKPV